MILCEKCIRVYGMDNALPAIIKMERILKTSDFDFRFLCAEHAAEACPGDCATCKTPCEDMEVQT